MLYEDMNGLFLFFDNRSVSSRGTWSILAIEPPAIRFAICEGCVGSAFKLSQPPHHPRGRWCHTTSRNVSCHMLGIVTPDISESIDKCCETDHLYRITFRACILQLVCRPPSCGKCFVLLRSWCWIQSWGTPFISSLGPMDGHSPHCFGRESPYNVYYVVSRLDDHDMYYIPPSCGWILELELSLSDAWNGWAGIYK